VDIAEIDHMIIPDFPLMEEFVMENFPGEDHGSISHEGALHASFLSTQASISHMPSTGSLPEVPSTPEYSLPEQAPSSSNKSMLLQTPRENFCLWNGCMQPFGSISQLR